MLWIAAIVVWRQRWAWWLYVIGGFLSFLPLAGRTETAPRYIIDVVLLVILLSPQMREYVGIRGRTHAA